VVVYPRSQSRGEEGVTTSLKRIRNFIEWLGELPERFNYFLSRLEEAGVFDVIADNILRTAGGIADFEVPDRRRLEGLVRHAVEGKVDELRSQVADPKDPSGLRDLVKNVIVHHCEDCEDVAFLPDGSYGDYVVSLPDGRVLRSFCAEPDWRVILTEVELPSTGSLVDFAVKKVRPDHEAPVSFEKQRLEVHYRAGHDRGVGWDIFSLVIGNSQVAEARFRADGHGACTGVQLHVSGLVALGLAEKLKPGVAGEILQKAKEAIRASLWGFAVTELFYSLLREQYMVKNRGG
jgi:hypothetical protein